VSVFVVRLEIISDTKQTTRETKKTALRVFYTILFQQFSPILCASSGL